MKKFTYIFLLTILISCSKSLQYGIVYDYGSLLLFKDGTSKTIDIPNDNIECLSGGNWIKTDSGIKHYFLIDHDSLISVNIKTSYLDRNNIMYVSIKNNLELAMIKLTLYKEDTTQKEVDIYFDNSALIRKPKNKKFTKFQIESINSKSPILSFKQSDTIFIDALYENTKVPELITFIYFNKVYQTRKINGTKWLITEKLNTVVKKVDGYKIILPDRKVNK